MFFICLLKQTESLFLMKYSNHRAIQVRTMSRSTVKILSFRDRWSGQIVKTENRLILRNQSHKGIHSCHSVCPFLCGGIIGGQGSAALAAGAGWSCFGLHYSRSICSFFFFCLLFSLSLDGGSLETEILKEDNQQISPAGELTPTLL